jgi:hypothetical protein
VPFRATHAVFLAMLVSLPALGGSTAPDDWEVMINMRPLKGRELRVYLRTTSVIEHAWSAVLPTRQAVADLVELVRGLPRCVRSDARSSLYSEIATSVADSTTAGDPLIPDLLGSADAALVDVGLTVIMNTDAKAWVDDERTSAAVRTVLAESRGEGARISAIWIFHLAGRFDAVREQAIALARQEENPPLARRAARAVSASLESQGDELPALFRSSSGILEQEAALALSPSDHLADEKLEDAVTSQLLEMVVDDELPPRARGDAIEALRWVSEQDRICEVLLPMLQPKQWFFGVQGQHYWLHSLFPVVGTLSDQCEGPEVTDALLELRRIVKARGMYEADVKWAIDHALEEHASPPRH